MKETMGQIVRRLRKERELTQEELAERLGVTFQAVSKWENDAGMPDISQVVPLARVFGVSTDTLFGASLVNDDEDALRIVSDAQKQLTSPLTAESLYGKYCAVKEGLKLYPNNHILLMHALEAGIALAYPENGELYDEGRGEGIYKDCQRYAELVISLSHNTTDILRANMIMVILHSAYGNFPKAAAHAEKFPYRADFNIHVMYAYYAHWKKAYHREAQSCQYGVLHYLEAFMNVSVRLSGSYMLSRRYKDAVSTLESALEVAERVFKDEDIAPPIHYREQGNMYAMLAEARLCDGDEDGALAALEKMTDYDLGEYVRINSETRLKTPMLCDIPHGLYRKRIDRRHELIGELCDERFAKLKANERYNLLIERIKQNEKE